MGKWKDRLLYELLKEPEKRKRSAGELAGRFLIGFFVMMLLLTILSRAADSVIVARIDVDSVNSGKLEFNVEGTGTLTEKAEKYLDIYAGVRINRIYAEEGKYVEKGDILFQYNVNDLQARLDDLEDDLRKAQISAEINKLSNAPQDAVSDVKKAKLVLERAELDQKTADEDLEEAKAKVNDTKKEEYETAKDNYEEAKKSRDGQAELRERAIQDAGDAIAEAEYNVNDLYADKTNMEKVIAEYKTAVEYPSGDSLIKAEENVFKQYYGETGYPAHQKEVEKARKDLKRAEEDYSNAKKASEEAGTLLSDSEKSIFRRAIDDAEDRLEEVTEKDTEIRTALIAYGNAIRIKNQEQIDTSYSALLSLLCPEDSEKKKQIRQADNALSEARETLTETTADWDRTMAEEEEKVTKALDAFKEAEAVYIDVISDSYDYSQDVKTEERLAESAARAVEDARLGVEEAGRNDSDAQERSEAGNQIEELNEEAAQIDINEKEEAVGTVKKLIENDGKVTAPAGGVVTKLELEEGGSTAGSEKIAVTTGNYGFSAKVSKEEAEHLSAGDEIAVKLGHDDEKTKIAIESIGSEDADGMFTITGILPKGEYDAGAAVPFTVAKQSESYSQVIPIQALRMDEKGNKFVLITKEKNTILGNALTAFRIDVTLIDSDYTKAAIEGILARGDELIIGSNKNIEEGDRVRINESNGQND